MGNFEKLSVLVIVVIIVMILVVALYTWTEDPNAGTGTATTEKTEKTEIGAAPPAPPANGKSSGTRVDLPDPLKLVKGGGAPAKPVDPADVFKDFFKPKPDVGAQSPGGDPQAQAPVVPPDPASVKPAEPRFHVVAAGETIAKIAKLEYPGVGQRAIDAIIKANPQVDPPRMREGTKLVLPELAAVAAPAPGVPGLATVRPSTPVAELRPGSVYVVRKGDTLPGISRRAYSKPDRWQDIWIENFGAIEDPDHLNAGTRLKLPK